MIPLSLLVPLLSISLGARNHTPQTPESHFRILLVGVDSYSKSESQWADLHGTSDVAKVRRLLETYWGKSQKLEIVELPDKQATKQNIEDKFSNWLVKDAKPEDKMLFFFSGHGTLVPAPDLSTKVRSAILPINARTVGTGVNAPLDDKSLITGEFFRKQLEELKKRSITNVTLIFDACNSAAISRGGLAVAKEVKNSAVDLPSGAGGEKIGLSNDIDLDDFMVINAARADRSAYETREGGNLTVAIAKTIHSFFGRRAQSKVERDFTYADLKDGVLANLADLPQPAPQEPSFNGKLNRAVFGSQTDPLEPYYLVSMKVGQLSVSAGQLFGVSANNTFSIYAPDTIDFVSAKPVARAKVMTANAYESDISLIGFKGDPYSLVGARARLIDGTPDATLSVDLSSVDSNPNSKGISGPLLTGTLFKRSTNGASFDVRILPPGAVVKDYDSSPDQWLLVGMSGKTIRRVSPSADRKTIIENLKAALTDVARGKAVRALKTNLPQVKLEVELVPVKLEGGAVTELGEVEAGHAGSGEFGDGEAFSIRVRASLFDGGTDPKKPVYLAILDCLPNGDVKSLWPKSGISGEPTKLLVDNTWKYISRAGALVSGEQKASLMAYRLSPSEGQGQELFKIFASDVNGVNYSPLMTRGAPKGEGESSAIGRVLGAFRDGQPVSRDVNSAVAEPTSFSITTVTIMYRPGKKK